MHGRIERRSNPKTNMKELALFWGEMWMDGCTGREERRKEKEKERREERKEEKRLSSYLEQSSIQEAKPDSLFSSFLPSFFFLLLPNSKCEEELPLVLGWFFFST
jgi:hypothetical protein